MSGFRARALLLMLLAAAGVRGQTPPPAARIDQRLNARIPLDVQFRDEGGQPVPLGKFFGSRPVIVVPVYFRCPRLCSVGLQNLADSVSSLDLRAGRDFEVVVVSIDPRERPELAAERKAALLEGRDAAGWHFLTGDEASIREVTDALGFSYSYDARQDLYAHASGLMMLTSEGTIARYLFGLEFSPRDLRFGLEDSSAGKIGSPLLQPLRLLCFTEDPATGGYALMTHRLVQLGGAATTLAIGTFLLAAWRHERGRLAPGGS